MDSYFAPIVAAILMILIENQGMKMAKRIKRFHKRIIRIGEGLVLGTIFIARALSPSAIVTVRAPRKITQGGNFVLISRANRTTRITIITHAPGVRVNVTPLF